ncbi:DnaB-like helicase C-terminal domain-containing protein [Mammaliicoccus sp. D-M17]|uniref:DnaB-like helicase C-terminal domain-containing protein n=1 Tax=Mammaliicoccus sp. D-M17 TaxID=2898677 RepID=UPI001EFB6103|nr:DnaB-like helicase C-terminal domain-containing protein [Mammaliicoccus sp. D-M17]
MNNEDLIIASLIQFPDLYTKLALTEDMFEDYELKLCIQYFKREGKADKHGLYAKAKAHPNDFISPERVRALLDEDLIAKVFFDQYQHDVLEAYKQRERIKAIELYKNSPNLQNKAYMDDVMKSMDELVIKEKDGKKDTLLSVMDDLMGNTKPDILKTGFNNLDSLIDGFQPGQLNMIGARPSAGKTALAINLGTNFAMSGCAVTFVSLETNERKITDRLLSSLSKVQLHKFKNADLLTDEDIEKVIDQIGIYEKLDFKILDNNNITPQKIRNIISNNDKQNVVIIDYVQLMKADGNFKDRRLEVETISRELKILAKETNAIIIALAQLSRGVEHRNDKRPMMSDLKEAGGLEQDGDVIMLLYRDDYYNQPEVPDSFGKSEVECIVAKNKDGQVGTVKLDFYKPIQRFLDA